VKYTEIKDNYSIATFGVREILGNTNQFLSRNFSKYKSILILYLLYSLLASVFYYNGIEYKNMMSIFLFIANHLLSLFMMAYFLLTLASEDEPVFDNARLNLSVGRMVSLVVTELSFFAVIAVFTLGLTLVVILPVVFIARNGNSVSLLTSVLTLFIVLPVLVFTIRFIYSWTITALYDVKGFSALYLSRLIFKKNRKTTVLLFVLFVAVLTLVSVFLAFSAQNRIVHSVVTLANAVFSMYWIIVINQIVCHYLKKSDDMPARPDSEAGQ